MSEIEKMYELAKIKPIEDKINSNQYQYYYPPFTAEKQLELVKFLSWHFEYGIKITKYLNGFSINNYTGSRCSELSKTFDESLASIVNKIWQDLTEEEKQQIKEILE